MPVGAELLVGGVRVVDQVPGDDEYRAGDGHQRFGMAAAFDDAAVTGAEEGVGTGGGVGGFASPSAPLSQGLPCPAGPAVFFAPDWMVRGHSFAQETRCSGVGRRLMSAPISALRCGGSDAGNGIETLSQDPRAHHGRRPVHVSRILWRGGDLFQGLGDELVEFVDLGGQVVDGGQQHPEQASVMVLELPRQGLGQGRLLLARLPLARSARENGDYVPRRPWRSSWPARTGRTGRRRPRTT